MEYIKLHLKHYKPLLINDIKELIYEPKAKIQWILGTNGSGKSSLLRELTPLPAFKNDYAKNGYKEIIILHNHKQFVLINDYTSNTHSFTINGVEENLNGSITYQKELTLKYFNIDNEIKDILLGVKSLTAMAPVDRKKWFTKISDTDTSYALNVYKILSDKSRDIKGSITLDKARLTTYINSMLDTNEEDLLKLEISSIKENMENILSIKSNTLSFSIQDSLDSLNNVKNNIDKLAKDIICGCNKLEKLNSNIDYQNISILIGNIEWEIADYKSKLKVLMDDFINQENIIIKLEQAIATMQDNNSDELKLHKEINSNKRKLKLIQYTDSLDIDYIIKNIQIAKPTLEYIFNNLPANINLQYSKKTYMECKDTYEQLKNKQSQCNKDISKYESLLEKMKHAKDHDPVTCPKCKYRWNPSYNEELYITYTNSLNNQIYLRDTYVKQEQHILDEINRIQEYFTIYKHYSTLTDTCDIKHFISILDTYNIIHNNPLGGINILNDYLKELNIIKQIYDLVYEKELVEKAKENVKNENLDTLQEKKVHLENIRIVISDLTDKLHIREKDISVYNEIKNKYKELHDVKTSINIQFKSYTDAFKEHIDQLLNTAINDVITELKMNLSEKEKRYNSMQSKRAIIQELEKNINDLSVMFSDYDLLLKVLSPVDGLIAKSTIGFINMFIQHMNNVISKIWSYPMTIETCHISEEDGIDLDYRFPLIINDGGSVKDVSIASSGMKEIIDLAFKLVCMKYLGLENIPLFLDELGSKFDPIHRLKIIDMINLFVNQSKFTQIFLVSHFNESLGSFNQSDISVLCDKNVILPKDTNYNNVLKLIYV